MVEWLQQAREFWNSLHTGVINDLGPWTYVALMVLVATEGPLSTLLGAAAAATDLLDVRWVLLATIAGNVLGDTVWYTVGYLHKLDTLFHYGKWLGVKRSQLDRLEARVQAHATTMILIAKVAYGLIVPTLVAAGLARVPWRKWFPIVFLLETIWSILLVYVGYHMTGVIAELERGLEIVVGAVWLAIIAAVIVWFRRRRRRAARAVEQSLQSTPSTETNTGKDMPESRSSAHQRRVPDPDTLSTIAAKGLSIEGENGYGDRPSLTGDVLPDDAQDDLRGDPVGEIGGKGRSK